MDSIVSAFRNSGGMLLPQMHTRGANIRRTLWSDLGAGITVATVLIPQSIAYALLAGIPPENGLYAALLGGIGGALWGSSKILATGPIALASLLSLIAVSPLAPVGSPQYITLVAALAVFVGVIQIAFGCLRLGFLVRLVPASVLVGFSSAAAFVIVFSQVPNFLGIPTVSSAFVFDQITHVATHIFSLNTATAMVGLAALGALLFLRTVSKKIPGNIIVLALGIIASYVFDLSALGVAMAGQIPSHLPTTDIPAVSFTQLSYLSGHALVLALVGFMSAYASVKEFAHKTEEKVNADQELVGQGFANLLAGVFRGCPVGGSLSRTAVNYDAGAQTAWSGVYASLAVALVILFFSHILSQLPIAVLAAILMVAVVPLIDFGELRRMYRITQTDGIIGVVTFGAVFVLRLDQAILLGVVLALVLYMHKVMWVHVVEVGFHPEWRSLVSTALFPNAVTYPQMLMLRIDAPIFYANIERLELEIEERLKEYDEKHQGVPKILALDFSGVNHIDVTGVEGFADIVRALHERRMQVFIITPRRGIREVLERAQLGGQVRLVHGNRELRLIGEAILQGKSLV